MNSASAPMSPPHDQQPPAAAPRRRRRDERAAAAVEFALVAPLLLILLFGMISYGYLLSFRQAVSQGAAEAARSAAVWSTDYSVSQQSARTTAAKARINEALGSYGVSCGGGAACAVSYAPCGTAVCVTVSVSYDYRARPLTPDFPLVPTPSRLSYSTSARVS